MPARMGRGAFARIIRCRRLANFGNAHKGRAAKPAPTWCCGNPLDRSDDTPYGAAESVAFAAGAESAAEAVAVAVTHAAHALH